MPTAAKHKNPDPTGSSIDALTFRNKYGKHSYKLADYGLEEAQVRERQASYYQTFGIPTAP